MALGGTWRSISLLIAIVALNLGLQVNDGLYAPAAIIFLLAALIATAGAFVLPEKSVSRRMWGGSMLTAVLIQLAAAFYRVAGATHPDLPPEPQGIYHAGIVAAALGLIAAWLRPRLATFAGVYLLIVFAVLGVWKIRSAPEPQVDVYFFQLDGPRALLSGIDPYSITFKNIYPNNAPVYGPGVVQNGRLMFGYPYTPLSLYWVTPAVAVFGDPRYALLLTMVIAGLLIWQIAGGAIGVMAAALLLFSPRAFYVIESAWTEPLSIMLLAAVVWLQMRGSRWTLWMFGLFLASKQYLPITLFLFPRYLEEVQRGNGLLVPSPPCTGVRVRERTAHENKATGNPMGPLPLTPVLSPVYGGEGVRRSAYSGVWLIPFAVAVIVSLPLILWNVPAFIHSAVTLQLHQPFRDDAMSLLVPIFREWSRRDATAVLAFLAAGIVGLISWVRRRDFSTSSIVWISLQLLVFFAFNKQAFVNYYMLVAGGLVTGLAHETSTRSRNVARF